MPLMPLPRRRQRIRRSDISQGLPNWIASQLTKLVEEVPSGDQWAHEIKLDGYRMHARLFRGRVQLLTRTGLDWTDKYTMTVEALSALPVDDAYMDGELCAIADNGVTSFSLMQAATNSRSTGSLVYSAFDLLFLDGTSLIQAPLAERPGADPRRHSIATSHCLRRDFIAPRVPAWPPLSSWDNGCRRHDPCR